jgi:hypothetical protein
MILMGGWIAVALSGGFSSRYALLIAIIAVLGASLAAPNMSYIVR